MLRADDETNQPVSAAAASRLLTEYNRALANADVVVLSDYGKGVLSDSVVAAAIAAGAAGVVHAAAPR